MEDKDINLKPFTVRYLSMKGVRRYYRHILRRKVYGAPEVSCICSFFGVNKHLLKLGSDDCEFVHLFVMEVRRPGAPPFVFKAFLRDLIPLRDFLSNL